MFEAISLALFACVMYFCLVVVPTVVENFSSEEFKKACMKKCSHERVEL